MKIVFKNRLDGGTYTITLAHTLASPFMVEETGRRDFEDGVNWYDDYELGPLLHYWSKYGTLEFVEDVVELAEDE